MTSLTDADRDVLMRMKLDIDAHRWDAYRPEDVSVLLDMIVTLDARLVDRCYLCNRREVDMNVTLDGAVRGLCSTCWERGQEGIRIPLDMTEDDDDD